MNNSYKHNSNKYTQDLEKMIELIEKYHGGCDDENCSMANMLNDFNSSMEEMVHWWACSGAACEEFNKLYGKHQKEILNYLAKKA